MKIIRICTDFYEIYMDFNMDLFGFHHRTNFILDESCQLKCWY